MIAPVLKAGFTLGAAALAYSWGYEVRNYQLKKYQIKLLPEGHREIKILHLSDLHLSPWQKKLATWLDQLEVDPDLVVITGDVWSSADSFSNLITALDKYFKVPGFFIPGSNDYYAPKFKNPANYLKKDSGERHKGRELPWKDLKNFFELAGWQWLSNQSSEIQIKDTKIDVRGVDDAHYDFDDLTTVSHPKSKTADLLLGLTHAPYLRVLDTYTQINADLILAGHTHGGQICLPIYGTIITNCDLPRELARGLNRYQDKTWLHVSAGLGTAPFTRVRFFCKPEASLITLTS
jgi:predicted MPP superfamily phosphohydrolase